MSALDTFPQSAILNPQSPTPALWAELFHGGQFRASFVSAGEAVRCASAFGSQACIVIDAQMREQWLADDMAVEEYPSHPSRAERALREIADRADLLCMALEDGRLVLWYRDAKAFSVYPPDVKLACDY